MVPQDQCLSDTNLELPYPSCHLPLRASLPVEATAPTQHQWSGAFKTHNLVAGHWILEELETIESTCRFAGCI